MAVNIIESIFEYDFERARERLEAHEREWRYEDMMKLRPLTIALGAVEEENVVYLEDRK